MGKGIKVECGCCGYKKTFFLGTGKSYNSTYNRISSRIGEGEYGEGVRNFLLENSNAVVNVTKEMYCCPECGFLKDDYSLGMYLCRGGNACKEKQSASPECNRDYLYVKSYYHDCPRCSGRMKKIREAEDTLLCPVCRKNIENREYIKWS